MDLLQKNHRKFYNFYFCDISGWWHNRARLYIYIYIYIYLSLNICYLSVSVGYFLNSLTNSLIIIFKDLYIYFICSDQEIMLFLMHIYDKNKFIFIDVSRVSKCNHYIINTVGHTVLDMSKIQQTIPRPI